MKWQLEQTVAPAAEPLTTAEVKNWVKQDASDDDTLIDNLVIGARQWVEDYTRRSLISQTWQMSLDCFPYGSSHSHIYLPRPTVTAITSVKYDDSDDTEQTWSSANYRLVDSDAQARLGLALNKSWPSDVAEKAGAVRVLYVAGWANAAAVPQLIKTAMLQLVAHWYENRETVVMGTSSKVANTVENLLQSYQVPNVGIM